VAAKMMMYRGTSLMRNRLPLGPRPYNRNTPRPLWWSYGNGLFLMREVALYQIGGLVFDGLAKVDGRARPLLLRRGYSSTVSSEYGTLTTVKARFWPCWLSDERPETNPSDFKLMVYQIRWLEIDIVVNVRTHHQT